MIDHRHYYKETSVDVLRSVGTSLTAEVDLCGSVELVVTDLGGVKPPLFLAIPTPLEALSVPSCVKGFWGLEISSM